MLQSRSFEKKLVKPLKNCFFGPNLHRKGVIMGYAQDGKKFFLAEITKADHQLSESFYFIKISYVLTELWIFFYLEWCFLPQKCHFQQKQLCSTAEQCGECDRCMDHPTKAKINFTYLTEKAWSYSWKTSKAVRKY